MESYAVHTVIKTRSIFYRQALLLSRGNVGKIEAVCAPVSNSPHNNLTSYNLTSYLLQ